MGTNKEIREIPEWEQLALISQEKRDKEKFLSETVIGYEDLGKIITYKGKYGVLVLSSDFGLDDENNDTAVCIRWDTNKKFDFEEYVGGNWVGNFVNNSYEFKFINKDGTFPKTNV